MDNVTVRELRNHGGAVLDRVARGESLIVTRDGVEVAELRPVRRRSPSTARLIVSRRNLPRVNARQLRADIEELLDSKL